MRYGLADREPLLARTPSGHKEATLNREKVGKWNKNDDCELCGGLRTPRLVHGPQGTCKG